MPLTRLEVSLADVADNEFRGGFVAPLDINSWVRYLASIQSVRDPTQKIPARHRRNIGYRLQLMEFECALLLLNIESVRSGRPSTLHSTVSAMKTQQFIVLTYSVLEGIGAHFVRVAGEVEGNAIDQAEMIGFPRWSSEIIYQIQSNHPAMIGQQEQLLAHLEQLKSWRNHIHLDRVDPEDRMLHFDLFYGSETFLKAYCIFRDFMGMLCRRWPATCLNEDNW